MKKTYNQPNVEIVKIAVEDVITTSLVVTPEDWNGKSDGTLPNTNLNI